MSISGNLHHRSFNLNALHLKSAAVFVFICILLEAGLFNSSFWNTGSHSSYSLSAYSNTQSKDGYVYMQKKGDAPICWEAQFDENVKVDSISFPLQKDGVTTLENKTLNNTTIQLTVRDQGTSTGVSYPQRQVDARVPSSQVFAIHPSGTVASISLCVVSVGINSIHLSAPPMLNARVPFYLSPIRLMLYLIIAIILIFRSKLWDYLTGKSWPRCDGKIIWRSAAFIAVVLTIAVGLLGSWKVSNGDSWQANSEYQLYANSLIRGHSYLDYPVPKKLIELDNPYDFSARKEAGLFNSRKPLYDINGNVNAADTALFDYAYKDGRYYSYFGVFPVLVTYIPYLLLTGHNLQNWQSIFIALVFVAFLAVKLAQLIKRRWANDAPDIPFAALGVAGALGVQPTMYLSYHTGLYSVPIAWALACALGAIVLWIRGSLANSLTSKYALYASGGIVGGFILGCRPQIALIVFLLPVIVMACRETDSGFPLLKTLDGWKEIVAASVAGAAGFLLTAIPFLLWNRIRFGSLFDFGSNYNLTGFDMTKGEATLQRGVIGLLTNLFATPVVNGAFPFIHAQYFDINPVFGTYQGTYQHEPVLGGLVFWVPITFIVLLIVSSRIKTIARSTGIGLLVGASLLLLFVIEFIDVSSVAITQRYICDAAFLAVIAIYGSFTVLYINPNGEFSAEWHERIAIRQNISIMLTIVTVAMSLLSILIEGRYDMLKDAQPYLYTVLQSAFALS